MDWESIGLGITAVSATLVANAFLTRLVIRNAILELKEIVAKEFVSRREFESHIKNCPMTKDN